ncbi:MAG: hypothetical protein KF841_11900 [Phycisphaerae bacterium]|nr:hypothetical protein [Phycisphaerae bacterium]
MNRIAYSLLVACLVSGTSCDRKPVATPGSQTPGTRQQSSTQLENADRPEGSKTHHEVQSIPLGSTVVDGLTVRATRDPGELMPGGEAAVDVWITLPEGRPPKDTIVRFWIGHEDARGALKAKADIEDPKEPSHWHTHVEVPEDLSPTVRLWVEIDTRGQPLRTVSFELGT